MTDTDDMPDEIWVFSNPSSIGDLGLTITEKKKGYIKYTRAQTPDTQEALEALSSPEQRLGAKPYWYTDNQIETIRAALEQRQGEIDRLKHIIKLKDEAIDRWVPCPDHRDKTEKGHCYICEIETIQKALKQITTAINMDQYSKALSKAEEALKIVKKTKIDYKIKAYNELIGDYSDELGFDKTIKLLNQIGYTIDKESWHDEDRLPDIESLGCIIEFLIQNPELEVPFLTTGGDGYFNAIWQKDRKHRVSIDFFPNNKTRWAFICIVPKSRESLGGNIPLESLFGRLENIGATKWMKGNQKC